ncbi:MAG: FGGY-family carbohydrate kinase [Flavisolibacter sp.]
MRATPVIAVIDVGKTNKKLFLFNEQYRIVYEQSARFIETVDEDGDPCENIESLRLSVYDAMRSVFQKKEFSIRAINFCTYGASLVYIDEEGNPLTPLYNYLKPYPQHLKKQFYDRYGGEEKFSRQTASPVLDSLNSGMQLYRIKYEKPELFRKINYALHLPQYVSYLISGRACSDITSIGCHTNLWDFEKNDYHRWVHEEGLERVLAPIVPCDETFPANFPGNNYLVGIGLHDSSASLIPYLSHFHEPFVLISTGTWCISLNPFNDAPLTAEELKQDCLCYLHFQRKPVKASRLFAGQEHEDQVKRIADHFHQDPIKYRTAIFNPNTVSVLKERKQFVPVNEKASLASSVFSRRELTDFPDDLEAYHQLMMDIMECQKASTGLVLKGTGTKRIFVDGGFSKNSIYMNLLAAAFPSVEVYAASIPQATAMGAALAIHHSWNRNPIPGDLIGLQFYSHGINERVDG